MGKCPECSEVINFLNRYGQAEKKSIFSLKEGKGDTSFQEYEDCKAEEDFTCPFCTETLAHDEQTAIKLLKGERTCQE